MTRVLVDDRCMRGQLTGVGVYLSELVDHWPRKSEITLHGALGLLHRRAPAAEIGPGVARLRPLAEALRDRAPSQGPPATTRGLIETGLRGVTRVRWTVGGFGAFFAPNNVPPVTPSPTVLTVHDLSPLTLPDCHPPHRVAWFRRAADRGLFGRARHIVCVSNATARTVREELGIDGSRIAVAPLGPRFEPPTGEEARVQIDAPRAFERMSILLGTVEPRKNHAALLDAYALLSPAERRAHALVFVGRLGWGDGAFWARLREHPMAGEVLWAGYLPDATTAALLARADVLLAPSKLEGFGLPVLEAARLGVPSVISPDPALREVAGPEAVVVDPDDAEGWARAMREPPAMTGGARAHAKRFNWTDCAKEHEKALAAVLD